MIAGCSGTGKTVVARRLAARFNASVLMADDIRMALQRVTTAEQQRALHYFVGRDDVWDEPAEVLCSGWVGVAEVVSCALEAVIAHHLCVDGVGSIIIEGDTIDPRLAARDNYTWCPTNQGVRAVVLHEPNESILLGNMRARGRGFHEFSLQEQIHFSRGAWQFGEWLKDGANACGFPVLATRPWETLEDRIVKAVGEPAPA